MVPNVSPSGNGFRYGSYKLSGYMIDILRPPPFLYLVSDILGTHFWFLMVSLVVMASVMVPNGFPNGS